jgi:hypothetical protein
LACLVLLSFLSLVLVLLLLVIEAFVRPRVESIGVASVAPAGCRLINGLSGLSFCGRVETNFDALVFRGREEAVDAVNEAVGCLGVEDVGVYEALGDTLMSSGGLLAIEASYAGKSRLDGMRDRLVCPNGRVVHTLGVRSFRCGSARQTNLRYMCFERRVRGCKVNAIAR